ncbi:MAG: hypothetical protein IGR90_04645 [Synechococcales cyanobacterium K32_A2020_035]|nr:hypothetical protein [Synechococcales cyanobacterium K32_A2020_035]
MKAIAPYRLESLAAIALCHFKSLDRSDRPCRFELLDRSDRLDAGIDKAIKSTYIKEGTAQNQTVIYNMCTRFFRWASDRLGQNVIIAFITNLSFIDSKTFDGFRKCIDREFDYVYIIDTQSDVRNNPKISGTKKRVWNSSWNCCDVFS